MEGNQYQFPNDIVVLAKLENVDSFPKNFRGGKK